MATENEQDLNGTAVGDGARERAQEKEVAKEEGGVDGALPGVNGNYGETPQASAENSRNGSAGFVEYVSRIRVIRALKITEDLFTSSHPNPKHIPGWIYNPGLRVVEVPAPSFRIAKVGEWVIEVAPNEFQIVTDEDFNKLYMPLIMTQRLPLSLVIPKKEVPQEANIAIIELCNIAHNAGFWLIGGFLPFKTLESGRLLESDPERPYGSFSNVGVDKSNVEKIPALLKELAQQIAFDIAAEKITESELESVTLAPQKAN